MVREILIWPDPQLKKKSKPVAKVDASVRALVKDMWDTMYDADGVGLAAPQLGVLLNVIVLDTRPRQPDSNPLAMINPVIIDQQGEATFREGCLSVPGEAEDTDRAAIVTVRYLDEQGREQTLTADGLLSVAIQHECDHLEGTLFVDYLSSLKRDVIKKRMKRLRDERAGEKEPRLAP